MDRHIQSAVRKYFDYFQKITKSVLFKIGRDNMGRNLQNRDVWSP